MRIPFVSTMIDRLTDKRLKNRLVEMGFDLSGFSNPKDFLLKHFLGSIHTAAGIDVGPETARKYAAFFACMRLIAQTEGMIPLEMFRRVNKRDLVQAEDLELFHLVRTRPNPEMSAAAFREALVAAATLYEGGYAEVQYNNAGDIMGFWPIPPWRVSLERDPKTKQLAYLVEPAIPGPRVTLWKRNPYRGFRKEMLHIHGIGLDGVTGWSLVDTGRNAISLGVAAENSAQCHFGSGMNASGVIEMPRTMTETARKNFKEEFTDAYTGLGKNRTIFLEEGITWKPTTMDPEKSQLLESRKLSALDVCMLMGVPPEMIGLSGGEVAKGTEEKSLHFYKTTMLAIHGRFADEFLSLLDPEDQKNFVFMHDDFHMLRGDMAGMITSMREGINSSIFKPDEMRAKLHMSEEKSAQKLFRAATMVPIDTPVGSTDPTGSETPEADPDNGTRNREVNQIASILEKRKNGVSNG